MLRNTKTTSRRHSWHRRATVCSVRLPGRHRSQLIDRLRDAHPYALCLDIPLRKKVISRRRRFHRSLVAVVVDHERGAAPDVDVRDAGHQRCPIARHARSPLFEHRRRCRKRSAGMSPVFSMTAGTSALQAAPVVELIRTQIQFDGLTIAWMQALQLFFEILVVSAELHDGDDRRHVLAELGMAQIRRQPPV